MNFNHGWTQMNTDAAPLVPLPIGQLVRRSLSEGERPGEGFLIRVLLCPSVVNFSRP